MIFAALVLLGAGAQAQNKGEKNYVIGFYNLENLFDTYNDPAKNDEEFLPEGKNKWTEAKYQKKLQNMAKVIRSMKEDNGAWHALLGVSEIENRLVLEDLVMEPQIAEANYQIIHYDGPDRRGVDVALLYKPEVFTYLDSESIPFTFEGSSIDFIMNQEQKDYFKTYLWFMDSLTVSISQSMWPIFRPAPEARKEETSSVTVAVRSCITIP